MPALGTAVPVTFCAGEEAPRVPKKGAWIKLYHVLAQVVEGQLQVIQQALPLAEGHKGRCMCDLEHFAR